ncbi:hypothetical protein Ccrd_024939, partial [Cynara cardunculus var. scolymus]
MDVETSSFMPSSQPMVSKRILRQRILKPLPAEEAVQKRKCRHHKKNEKNLKLARVANEVEDEVVQVLRTRSSPLQLCLTIQNFQIEQRKFVTAMGLKSILHFSIEYIPSRLGFFVVDNFDDERMVLKLPVGELEITKNSIQKMLGFPTGPICITQKITNSNDKVVRCWRNQFPQTKKEIHPSLVVEHMKQQIDGGDMLKLNFFVLVATCLCESMKAGTANQRLLHCIAHKEDIDNLDWCEFVIDCLKRSKKNWNRADPTSYYCGPLMFLILLYVDGLLCKDLHVERSSPAIKIWTT